MKKNKKSTFIILIVILAIIIMMFIGFINLDKPMDPSCNESISVVIPRGSATSDIANILEEKSVIDSAFKFKLLSKIKGYDGKFKSGEYSFNKSMKPSEIATVIIKGIDNRNTFTIPEGFSIYKIGKRLEEKGICTQSEFENELENGSFDYSFLHNDISGIERYEGYLYPDTYSFSKHTTAHDIIKACLDNFEKKYNNEIKRNLMKKPGKSLKEIMTVASIVEREAVKSDERPLVAGVIYNRLEKNMKLQMCSTVQYLLKEDKPVLSIEDTEISSDYNTYIHEGLPPGPICNPGMASIKAAANPEKTKYIYFVVSSKLDGSMEYSSDYDKFLKDKEKYYDALEKSGK